MAEHWIVLELLYIVMIRELKHLKGRLGQITWQEKKTCVTVAMLSPEVEGIFAF